MEKMSSAQSGFTLVEVALIVMVTGLIIGAIFSFLPAEHNERAEEITVMREQKIANALSYYAQMHYRLPCPSLPIVTPIGSPTSPTTCQTPPLRNGTVPFRVLGLSIEDVTDGFGNPISYTVSATAVAPDTTHVEAAFRLSNWMNAAQTANLNKRKAAFCGSQEAMYSMNVWAGTSLPGGIFIAAPVQSNVAGTLGYFDFKDADTKATSSKKGDPNYHIDYYAYVLVSHGKNGVGSYTFCDDDPLLTPGCTNNRKPGIDGTYEAQNTQNFDIRYNLLKNNSGADDNFDDIVLWRTQTQVISEFGNDSCDIPYTTGSAP